jgi:purine-binding chemotaxis protein CheW
MLQGKTSVGAAGAGSLAGSPPPTRQYLTFLLNGEVFALGILSVKEIIEYSAPTAVPLTPAYVRGVINLRGAVVPVLDLSIRFGKPEGPVTKRTCILILEIEAGAERHDLGVVVDAVNAVLEIPSEDIQPPPAFGTYVQTDFIEGMGKVKGRFVIVLDVQRVLADDEMLALTQVHGTAETPVGS